MPGHGASGWYHQAIVKLSEFTYSALDDGLVRRRETTAVQAKPLTHLASTAGHRVLHSPHPPRLGDQEPGKAISGVAGAAAPFNRGGGGPEGGSKVGRTNEV